MKFYKIKTIGLDSYEIEYAESMSDALKQFKSKCVFPFHKKVYYVCEAETDDIQKYCDTKRVDVIWEVV